MRSEGHDQGPDFKANAYFFLATKKYAHLDICITYFIS
jgi:hypothetical protein